MDNILQKLNDLILKVEEERAEYFDYIERCRLEDMAKVRERLDEIRLMLDGIKK